MANSMSIMTNKYKISLLMLKLKKLKSILEKFMKSKELKLELRKLESEVERHEDTIIRIIYIYYIKISMNEQQSMSYDDINDIKYNLCKLNDLHKKIAVLKNKLGITSEEQNSDNKLSEVERHKDAIIRIIKVYFLKISMNEQQPMSYDDINDIKYNIDRLNDLHKNCTKKIN